MGQFASKRVSRAFEDSQEFESACNSEYERRLSLTQHAFPGVLPYQLFPASQRLHSALSTANPLISKWVPTPPTRAQVDRAYRFVASRPNNNNDAFLGRAQFKAFAVELFRDAVLDNAGRAVVWRLPVGIAGIAGIGFLTRSGKEVAATAIGFYAFGVATSIYLGLSG